MQWSGLTADDWARGGEVGPWDAVDAEVRELNEGVDDEASDTGRGCPGNREVGDGDIVSTGTSSTSMQSMKSRLLLKKFA